MRVGRVSLDAILTILVLTFLLCCASCGEGPVFVGESLHCSVNGIRQTSIIFQAVAEVLTNRPRKVGVSASQTSTK